METYKLPRFNAQKNKINLDLRKSIRYALRKGDKIWYMNKPKK
jgi:hypothetical protein